MNFKNYIPVILSVIFMTWPVNTYAQKITIEEELAGEYMENNYPESEIEHMIEMLSDLRENPVNLNSCTKDELSSIFFITEFQAMSIVAYRNEKKQFMSKYELEFVTGFNRELAFRIYPYVYAGKKNERNQSIRTGYLQNGRQMVLTRAQSIFERQNGYRYMNDSTTETAYPGNPLKVNFKYSYKLRNKVIFGFTFEKDQGESTGKHNPMLFDFSSAHLLIRPGKFIQTITIGDFKANFGEGLITGVGFTKSKFYSIETSGNYRNGLVKYSSCNENHFFRGAGIEFGSPRARVTLFGSSKKIDANTEFRLVNDNLKQGITSFPSSGLHRTIHELENKDAVKEQLGGISFNYSSNQIIAGITGVGGEYNLPVFLSGTPSDIFNFKSSEFFAVSMHYRVNHGPFYGFGETAIDQQLKMAHLHGLSYYITSNCGLSIIYRNYEKGFHAPYGNGFGNTGKNSNEKGLFAGLFFTSSAKFKINAFTDRFSHEWLKYDCHSPSRGTEYHLRVDYYPTGNLTTYLRYRYKTDMENLTGAAGVLKVPGTRAKNDLRLHLMWSPNDKTRLSNRIEFSRVQNEKNITETGSLFYQDVTRSFMNNMFKLGLRYSVFHPGGFDTRIYMYENDLLYSFSVPAYYYPGSRFYLLISGKTKWNLDYWLKLGRTYYNDRESIGTGNEKSMGPSRTEIKIQIIKKIQ